MRLGHIHVGCYDWLIMPQIFAHNLGGRKKGAGKDQDRCGDNVIERAHFSLCDLPTASTAVPMTASI